jgi:hypothetical protein
VEVFLDYDAGTCLSTSQLLAAARLAFEVGVGTGRFAAPLGLRAG